jgi:membrane-associated phospholipid phosphatase
MILSKAIGLTNVGLWAWALWRLTSNQDTKPFVKLLMLSIAVDFLKRGFRHPRPKSAKACDALGIGGPSLTFGMPSGHVATAVAGWYMLAESLGFNPMVAALLAGLSMGWARVDAGCHTPLQSLMGGLFGWLVASTKI